jgi:hypothetical protein
VTIHDAVKRALPETAPKPGAFRKGAGDETKGAKQAEPTEAPAEGGGNE